jgi:transcriptional regulator with XRE-family HTH domain
MGTSLRQVRKRRGLSQSAFAQPLGIDRSYLSKIENGERTLSVPLLAEIRLAHRLSDDEILFIVRGHAQLMAA